MLIGTYVCTIRISKYQINCNLEVNINTLRVIALKSLMR